MGLLSRLSNLFSSTPASSGGPSAATASSPLAPRSANRVQKPRATNARQRSRRTQKLANGVSKGLRNESPEASRPRRDGNWASEADDVATHNNPTPDPGMRSKNRLRGDDEDMESETSHPDDHKIVIYQRIGRGGTPTYDSQPRSSSTTFSRSNDGTEPRTNRSHKDEAAAEEEGSRGKKNRTLEGLTGHRWNDGAFDVMVEWHTGECTYEPERNIHLEAPQLLFRYWQAQGGRPLNPEDPEMFDILAIRAHTKRRVLVEWTGYPPSENTWLPRKDVRETAPDAVKEYFDGLKKGQEGL